MKQHRGFTLIEILLLIVVAGLLGNIIILSLNTASLATPRLAFNSIADQAAKQCIEWFIGQRRLVGYDAIACPSTTVPSICVAPSGYTLSVNVACTTINSDNNYKTITVQVTGPGNSLFQTLIAAY